MLCLRDDIRRAAPAQRDKLSDDDGSLGSRREELKVSESLPLYPQNRKSATTSITSGSGQQRTQWKLFDHSSASASKGQGTAVMPGDLRLSPGSAADGVTP